MVSLLSYDLQITVYFHLERGNSNDFIKNATKISTQQIQRMKANWTQFGEVTASKMSLGGRPRALGQYHELQLLGYLEQRLTAYLDKMCWFLFDIAVNEFNVCRALQCLSWSRKKAKWIAVQQCQALWDNWMNRLGGWTASQLIFLDKSAGYERTGNKYFLMHVCFFLANINICIIGNCRYG